MILRITWESWQTVRAYDGAEHHRNDDDHAEHHEHVRTVSPSRPR